MEEKVLLNATVCLLVKGEEVLLGLKMKKIGAGCRNGYGGGIDEGESSKQSAIRELEEETGKKNGSDIFITTTPECLEKVAIIDFENTKSDGSSFFCKVHFFIIREWIGEAIDTDEMTDPQFFKIDNLPSQMMPADSQYFPLILKGKKILAKAKYGPYQKELLGPVIIEEVFSLPED